jgi:phage gpG-like protein
MNATASPLQAEQLDQHFAGVSRSLAAMDWGPALDKCADKLQTQVESTFAQQTSPSGVAWPEWFFFDPRESSPTHDTLNATGRLLGSLKRGGSDHIESITRDELVYGTSVPYAGIHDEGAVVTTGVALYSRGGRFLPAGSTINIPQRQFSGFTEETLVACGELIADRGLEVFLG